MCVCVCVLVIYICEADAGQGTGAGASKFRCNGQQQPCNEKLRMARKMCKGCPKGRKLRTGETACRQGEMTSTHTSYLHHISLCVCVCVFVCGGRLISRKLKCYMHCHCPMAVLRLSAGIVNSAAAAASIVPVPRPPSPAYRTPPTALKYALFLRVSAHFWHN